MRWSIRYRLLVPLGLLLLGVIATSIWSAILAAGHAKERITRRVLEVSETAAAASYPLTPNVLRQLKGYAGAEFLLLAADGSRTSTFPDVNIELPSRVSSDDREDSPLGVPVKVGGAQYRFRKLMIQSYPNNGATLCIFYPESSLQEAQWDAVRPSLVLGLFGGLAAVAVAIGIGQRLASRIGELERRTRLIAAGDFSPMPLPGQNDELRDLAQSVNEMAQRLAQLREAVQRTERLRLAGQLSSGLAHQLRNSVTGARLALQVLAEEQALRGSEAVSVILRQLDLMEANLRRFMDLGKTEGWQHQACSLPQLIDEAIALLRPQCDHVKTQLIWQPSGESAIVDGDAGQLRDLFLNVIHNAVEAAGPGGTVEVRLITASNQGRHAIQVWDTGPGPMPSVADRLFEPFVTGKPEGIGLGLAVARQSAEAHGGRIDWRREGGRTCFRIELPVAIN